ncbi:DUF4350 domain-containing protein [Salinigranum halophilum]|uniref:DUF4350 domain-containing protein n=1 Tax=Salinigranum halophilum TaxID=2565931 RepID=UPI0010A76642|nr:DUF4350 domain-containing protein [Salinigranum halophilum]
MSRNRRSFTTLGREFTLGYPELLLAGLVVVLVLGVGIGITSSQATYGSYNSAWDGASGLRGVAESTDTPTHLVTNTSGYAAYPARGTVSFVFSPESAYNEADRATLESFVERGGTLVVAEDIGEHGNDLLNGIGASARVDGQPVRDPRYNEGSGTLPLATNVSSAGETATLTRGVEELALNYPTAVEPGDSTVVARTSGFSYLDSNRNGTLDSAEALRSYPVVTVERIGQGRVIVVSDPSLFINAMLDRGDNRAFVTGLVDTHDRVVLDYSHAPAQPPAIVALLTLRDSVVLQILSGSVLVASAVLVARGWPPLARRGDERAAEESDVDSELDLDDVDDSAVVQALRGRAQDEQASVTHD